MQTLRSEPPAARAELAPAQPQPLSEREREVLALLADGRPNREIGAILCISEGTVKTHLKHIFGKLGARNRTEAALIGRERLLAGRGPA